MFTFDSATGQVCRVEKIDPVTGRALELSESEYSALDHYLEAVVPEPAPVIRMQSSPAFSAAATRKAYWQGMADCAALYRRAYLTK